MGRPLTLILVAGSLAVGTPAVALAAGGDDAGAPAATQPVQQQQEQQRDRGDCPEHESGRGSGSAGDASVAL
jgi:hypothetical protein